MRFRRQQKPKLAVGLVFIRIDDRLDGGHNARAVDNPPTHTFDLQIFGNIKIMVLSPPRALNALHVICVERVDSVR